MEPTALICFIAAACAGVLALFVFIRESGSAVRNSLGAGLLVLGLESLFAGAAIHVLLPENMVLCQRLNLVCAALLPGPWLLFSLTYARGNHAEYLRRWRMPLAAAFVAPPLAAAAGWSNLLHDVTCSTDSPTPTFGLSLVGVLILVVVLVSAVLVLMNLERSLRHAVGTMRWRMKYMVMGAGVLFAVRIYTATQALLDMSVGGPLAALNAGALLLGALLILRSLVRTQLLNVDLYLSQSALYHSVTLVLVGGYLLLVGALSRVVRELGVGLSFPLGAFILFVALAALFVTLMSDRMRQYSRILINRHFRRPHYDYRSVWTAFTHRTAAATDVGTFCRALTQLVSETLDVLSATIWIVDDSGSGLKFGGSTSLSRAQAAGLVGSGNPDGALIKALGGRDRPFDMDAGDDAVAEAFRKVNPDWFRKGGHRVCVPLVAGGETLGVMTLGDRVRALAYTSEEFDLLQVLGEQAAANLLNIRLSERLLQAKQLEAFQAMSAFFVHDLKNTSSTLSLMLQNLPGHFSDPAFREDALKAMGKSVARMNELIKRLTVLRQTMTIQPREADLNRVVRESAAGCGGPPDRELVIRAGPVPPVVFDPEQIGKVLTNLLLNAAEATQPGGRIEIETGVAGRWVFVAVRDDGCGMSPEFVSQSLFRPFKSTKKSGMGIGLFHSRTIMDAHGGKLEVSSEEGAGSLFRLLLPLEGGRRAEAPDC